MSNINDGGPAYPCHTNPLPGKLANAPQGMSLRDWFAGQALNGYLSQACDESFTAKMYVRLSYLTADAMLAEREVKS